VEIDTVLLQPIELVERVQGGSEHTVQLGDDHHITRLQGGQQRSALRTIRQRL
jgi:hypothetical protein